ncbi:hypothetical protein BH23BAC3_BH23BAC3_01770 [soil metagenome]
MQVEQIIKKTGDGSTTLISAQFDQPYHSLGGAVLESRYVYFKATGLDDRIFSPKADKLNIMEVGFGSGMNLVLLMDYIEKSEAEISVTYTSVEAYPLLADIVEEIDFGDQLEYLNYHNLLHEIFSNLTTRWNRYQITPKITLNLFVGFFNELTNPGNLEFDYIMHDPFSPDSNPAGWTADLFAKLAEWSSDDVMLSTYCAATSARAAMAAGGWKIARAPGALGKREMTVASINPNNLSHLKRVNEKRLIERFESGEFGQPFRNRRQ